MSALVPKLLGCSRSSLCSDPTHQRQVHVAATKHMQVRAASKTSAAQDKSVMECCAQGCVMQEPAEGFSACAAPV